MFEKAVREKYRFESPAGMLSVEDLWDLPLSASAHQTNRVVANLNDIAKSISKRIKETSEESFVDRTSAASYQVNILNEKLDILKHIIAVRLAENEVKQKAAENKAKKEKIMEILAKKQDEQLLNASEEELKGLLASL